MKIQWNGGALLAPLPPVMVSCGSMERPNVMTAAWTGIINTKPPKTYVSIRPERYSYGLIKEGGELVINLTTAALVRTADFCGVRSGRDLDKFAACGITPAPSYTVSCPSIAESPLSLECKLISVLPLGSEESPASHEMFLCDITAVSVDESLIDQNGKLHLEKCGLAAYAHGEYYALGQRLGHFGFSVRKKKKKKK